MCARKRELRRLPRRARAVDAALPLAIAGVALVARAAAAAAAAAGAASRWLAVTALGPLLYRIAYQPVAEASVLVLLIVSVALHFAMLGFGLLFFGAEGSRTPAFSVGDRSRSAASTSACRACWWSAPASALIGALALFFGRTLYGKALRATAVNRVGARLCGISPEFRRRADLHAGRAALRVLRRADRADHHGLLRLRVSRQPQGLRRRHHRRARELSAGGRRRAAGRPDRIILVVLGERASRK